MGKMHANEFTINTPLVQKLVAKQFPSWAHLELKKIPSTGTDNVLYRLGNDKLVRLPRIDWAIDNIEKEFQWLPQLAPLLPKPIPKPLKMGFPEKDYPYPWSIYTWIEGVNPTSETLSHEFLEDLIEFIQALHKIKAPNAPLCNRGGPLKDKDPEMRKTLKELKGSLDIDRLTEIWEKALSQPAWEKEPLLLHGDLLPGNLLSNNDRLVAVIDFGNLGLGDPACDLIIAWSLLPNDLRNTFRTNLRVDDATWERGKGWALFIALIQLAYYKTSNPALAKTAMRTIQELDQTD